MISGVTGQTVPLLPPPAESPASPNGWWVGGAGVLSVHDGDPSDVVREGERLRGAPRHRRQGRNPRYLTLLPKTPLLPPECLLGGGCCWQGCGGGWWRGSSWRRGPASPSSSSSAPHPLSFLPTLAQIRELCRRKSLALSRSGCHHTTGATSAAVRPSPWRRSPHPPPALPHGRHRGLHLDIDRLAAGVREDSDGGGE